MDAYELARYVGMEPPEAWVECLPAAMTAYRSDWLDRIDFEPILDFYEFKEEYRTRLRGELALLRGDETLRRVCWLMHYILYYAPMAQFRSVWSWGKYAEGGVPGGHATPVTCVVALLAGQPIHARTIAERGYDASQIAGHKRGVRGVWVGEHESKGVDGVRFTLMIWGAYFVRGILVRIGRLQYEYGVKDFPTFSQTVPEGTPIVALHIPAGQPLDAGEVEQSLALARKTLGQYFPGVDGARAAFFTHTWLLSPQLAEMLPPESNIMKFQKLFKIFSTADGTRSFLDFLFKETRAPGTFDYNELAENSSLQRAVKRRLLAGLPLELASGYILPE